jgi:hypothetical protein
VVCDWDGDGLDDLVVGRGQSQEVLVLLGGRGGLGAKRSEAIALDYRVHYETGLFVGDFDGDGLPDLAAFGYTPTGVGWVGRPPLTSGCSRRGGGPGRSEARAPGGGSCSSTPSRRRSRTGCRALGRSGSRPGRPPARPSARLRRRRCFVPSQAQAAPAEAVTARGPTPPAFPH